MNINKFMHLNCPKFDKSNPFGKLQCFALDLVGMAFLGKPKKRVIFFSGRATKPYPLPLELSGKNNFFWVLKLLK